MNKTEVFIPLVFATLIAGCVISSISGDYEHWIPIVLALVVVAGLAISNHI
jgi:hypothetical protein